MPQPLTCSHVQVHSDAIQQGLARVQSLLDGITEDDASVKLLSWHAAGQTLAALVWQSTCLSLAATVPAP